MNQRPHDPAWLSVLNTLAIAGLFYSLPPRLTAGPAWLIPSITVLLLVGAVTANRTGKVQLNFIFGISMESILTMAEAWSLFFLIAGLSDKRLTANALLRSAAAIWVSNVLIFASWYWRLDAGGPHRRSLRDRHSEGAFLFPQMTLPPDSHLAPRGWKPGFIDYLFLAFNTSAAFSPTDTPVLSPWAKGVMMMQGTFSLAAVVILLARGINLL